MKRILAHIPEAFGSEEEWRRGLHLAIFRIKDDVRRGCARLLLGSGCWPPSRECAAGYRSTSACDFCPNPNATLGHQLYQCP
eukprot:3349813-Pyramimonas_sp.AAC.1